MEPKALVQLSKPYLTTSTANRCTLMNNKPNKAFDHLTTLEKLLVADLWIVLSLNQQASNALKLQQQTDNVLQFTRLILTKHTQNWHKFKPIFTELPKSVNWDLYYVFKQFYSEFSEPIMFEKTNKIGSFLENPLENGPFACLKSTSLEFKNLSRISTTWKEASSYIESELNIKIEHTYLSWMGLFLTKAFYSANIPNELIQTNKTYSTPAINSWNWVHSYEIYHKTVKLLERWNMQLLWYCRLKQNSGLGTPPQSRFSLELPSYLEYKRIIERIVLKLIPQEVYISRLNKNKPHKQKHDSLANGENGEPIDQHKQRVYLSNGVSSMISFKTATHTHTEMSIQGNKRQLHLKRGLYKTTRFLALLPLTQKNNANLLLGCRTTPYNKIIINKKAYIYKLHFSEIQNQNKVNKNSGAHFMEHHNTTTAISMLSKAYTLDHAFIKIMYKHTRTKVKFNLTETHQYNFGLETNSKKLIGARAEHELDAEHKNTKISAHNILPLTALYTIYNKYTGPLYMPFQTDFRGRIYFTCVETPQGHHVQRRLFMAAEPTNYTKLEAKHTNSQHVDSLFSEITPLCYVAVQALDLCVKYGLHTENKLTLYYSSQYWQLELLWVILEFSKPWREQLGTRGSEGHTITFKEFLIKGVDVLESMLMYKANTTKAFPSKKFELEEQTILIQAFLIFKELDQTQQKKRLIFKDATASFTQHLGLILGFKNDQTSDVCNLGPNSKNTWQDPYEYIILKFKQYILKKHPQENHTELMKFFNRTTLKTLIMINEYSATQYTLETAFWSKFFETQKTNANASIKKILKYFIQFLKEEAENILFKKTTYDLENWYFNVCTSNTTCGDLTFKSGDRVNLWYYKTKKLRHYYTTINWKTKKQKNKTHTAKGLGLTKHKTRLNTVEYRSTIKQLTLNKDLKKTRTAIKANIVHSCDAQFLHRLIKNLQSGLITVHDSVGFEFGQISKGMLAANKAIRQVAFQSNNLFHKNIRKTNIRDSIFILL